jgi:hypothetical protein
MTVGIPAILMLLGTTGIHTRRPALAAGPTFVLGMIWGYVVGEVVVVAGVVFGFGTIRVAGHDVAAPSHPQALEVALHPVDRVGASAMRVLEKATLFFTAVATLPPRGTLFFALFSEAGNVERVGPLGIWKVATLQLLLRLAHVQLGLFLTVSLDHAQIVAFEVGIAGFAPFVLFRTTLGAAFNPPLVVLMAKVVPIGHIVPTRVGRHVVIQLFGVAELYVLGQLHTFCTVVVAFA